MALIAKRPGVFIYCFNMKDINNKSTNKMNGKGIQEKEEIKVQKDKGKEKRVMENI
jgi:hypothetical protein